MSALIQQACSIIQKGGVIVYPTEAVWGIGCDPWNKLAVDRILQIKQRSWQKGLIMVASSEQQIQPLLAGLTKKQRIRVTQSWPGPYTWVIEDKDQWVPAWVKGQFQSVAVRVSAHPLIQKLCQNLDAPIISTSANISNESAVCNEADLNLAIIDQVDFVLSGLAGGDLSPSRIIDAETGHVLRES